MKTKFVAIIGSIPLVYKIIGTLAVLLIPTVILLFISIAGSNLPFTQYALNMLRSFGDNEFLEPYQMKLADINSDGIDDVLIANQIEIARDLKSITPLTIIYGTRRGETNNFLQPRQFNISLPTDLWLPEGFTKLDPLSFSIADLNGDFLDDIVLTYNGYDATWSKPVILMQEPNINTNDSYSMPAFSFVLAEIIEENSDKKGGWQVISEDYQDASLMRSYVIADIADLNNDYAKDIILSTQKPDQQATLSILQNTGNGYTFLMKKEALFVDERYKPSEDNLKYFTNIQVVLEDLNHDSSVDLVILGKDFFAKGMGPFVRVLINQSSFDQFHFSENDVPIALSNQLPLSLNQAPLILVEDVNQDYFKDLVFLTYIELPDNEQLYTKGVYLNMLTTDFFKELGDKDEYISESLTPFSEKALNKNLPGLGIEASMLLGDLDGDNIAETIVGGTNGIEYQLAEDTESFSKKKSIRYEFKNFLKKLDYQIIELRSMLLYKITDRKSSLLCLVRSNYPASVFELWLFNKS